MTVLAPSPCSVGYSRDITCNVGMFDWDAIGVVEVSWPIGNVHDLSLQWAYKWQDIGPTLTASLTIPAGITTFRG